MIKEVFTAYHSGKAGGYYKGSEIIPAETPLKGLMRATKVSLMSQRGKAEDDIYGNGKHTEQISSF